MTVEKCACGQPLHYRDPDARRAVDRLNAREGPDIPVTVNGRTWLVPRHYIALHGIKGEEVESLGFPEVD